VLKGIDHGEHGGRNESHFMLPAVPVLSPWLYGGST